MYATPPRAPSLGTAGAAAADAEADTDSRAAAARAARDLKRASTIKSSSSSLVAKCPAAPLEPLADDAAAADADANAADVAGFGASNLNGSVTGLIADAMRGGHSLSSASAAAAAARCASAISRCAISCVGFSTCTSSTSKSASSSKWEAGGGASSAPSIAMSSSVSLPDRRAAADGRTTFATPLLAPSRSGDSSFSFHDARRRGPPPPPRPAPRKPPRPLPPWALPAPRPMPVPLPAPAPPR